MYASFSAKEEEGPFAKFLRCIFEGPAPSTHHAREAVESSKHRMGAPSGSVLERPRLPTIHATSTPKNKTGIIPSALLAMRLSCNR